MIGPRDFSDSRHPISFHFYLSYGSGLLSLCNCLLSTQGTAT